MLQTKLQHLAADKEIQDVISANENVMICCGRMGPMCIPVYAAMVQIEQAYTHVVFRDLDFDCPAAERIRSLPECAQFMGLPFTVYYKSGAVAAATSGLQSRAQIEKILAEKFGKSA